MDKKIGSIRRSIDQIDKDIISLLEKRMVFVNEIGSLKSRTQDISYIKADREHSMMQKLSRVSSVPKGIIFQIWRNIISYSLYNEKKYKICFLGDREVFDKAYYLIRGYFSCLPEVGSCESGDIKKLDAFAQEASGIVVAEISNRKFVEFLIANKEFKIFAKLESEIGEGYFAAAKIPKEYLARENQLYLVEKLDKSLLEAQIIYDGSSDFIVCNPYKINSGDILLGAYANI